MLDGKKSILVLNGPNLNMLGTREPHIYGYDTLADVETKVSKLVKERGGTVSFLQSNWEGALLDRIQAARFDGTDAIVLNPGGFTHYSVPLRDCLLGVNIPFVELHVGNYIGREEWRQKSIFRDKATALIMGCGIRGYEFAAELILSDDTKFPPKAEPQK